MLVALHEFASLTSPLALLLAQNVKPLPLLNLLEMRRCADSQHYLPEMYKRDTVTLEICTASLHRPVLQSIQALSNEYELSGTRKH